MIIKGLIKTTLLDYPGKIACTIFLFGCNMRCGFCHNPDLVIDPAGKRYEGTRYSEEEILAFLEKRKNYLDGVCITGGEPLLSLNIDFLRKIKQIKSKSSGDQSHYKIKIDTNGTFPQKLKEIINYGLVDYIAMDIKGSKEKYKDIISFPVDMENIEESIKIISSFPQYEFRTTFVNRFHNKDEIVKVMEWLRELTSTQNNNQNHKLLNYYFQGFRKGSKLMDESFFNEPEVKHDDLLVHKQIAENYFANVGIRA